MLLCGCTRGAGPRPGHHKHLPSGGETRPGHLGPPRAQAVVIPAPPTPFAERCAPRAGTVGSASVETTPLDHSPHPEAVRSALCPQEGDSLMVWAAAAACFFGFFRAGELTVPAAAALDSTQHLAWGDVFRVFLKVSVSKCDQFGHGVAVSWALPPMSCVPWQPSWPTCLHAGTRRVLSSAVRTVRSPDEGMLRGVHSGGSGAGWRPRATLFRPQL